MHYQKAFVGRAALSAAVSDEGALRMRHTPCGCIPPRISDAETIVPALVGKARCSCAKRKNAIPQSASLTGLAAARSPRGSDMPPACQSREAASLPFTQGSLSTAYQPRASMQKVSCQSQAEGRVVFAPLARNFNRADRHTSTAHCSLATISSLVLPATGGQ